MNVAFQNLTWRNNELLKFDYSAEGRGQLTQMQMWAKTYHRKFERNLMTSFHEDTWSYRLLN